MRKSEVLFLCAGAGVLLSLSMLNGAGLYLWIAAKIAYGLGIVFYIREFVLKPQ